MKIILSGLIAVVVGVALILGNAWQQERAELASELLREQPAQQGGGR